MTDVNDTVGLKDLLTTASPLIKSLVDTFVAPKLVAFRDKLKDNKNINLVPTESHFTEYFHRTYKKLAVVNTLVFNNSQRFLSDIFLPLTLTNTNDKKVKTKINGFPSSISDEYGNILITDTAGMGKSTLMKTIFIDVINKNIGIPIFIELRRLTTEKKLLQEIQEQLNSIDKNFDKDLLLELLSEGGFIIILDGFDEIPLNDRESVTTDLQEFISKASNNRFFITSRPEKALSSFGHFQEFKIDPLTKNQAFELLRKYDSQGQVSTLLIKKLQEKELANIEEFLTNPLLVSLLFTAFEHKQAIPFKKYLFYRQVYDANFESHDLTKGDSYTHDKYSKLEIDDFHRVLRHIGFNCFKIQKIEFTKDELLKLINESKEFCVGLKFNDSDFLLDLLKTVPLFTQDGNYYRWSHKSLQEYFAAQFIYLDSKDKQNIILSKLYNHINLEKFINVLDLYYDMDYKTFRNIIEFDLLKEYNSFQLSTYLDNNEGITNDDIIKRKELLFLYDSYLFKAVPENGKQPFEDNKLNKMLSEFQTQNKFDRNRFSGLLITNSKTDNCYVLHYQNPKSSILNLLLNKKNSIVTQLGRNQKDDNIVLDFTFEKEYYPNPLCIIKKVAQIINND
ncbi:NACHT domain-containing protein [Flavobacterium croceum DSM 17960]|uniref:NACHT domain-containing protein n=1 Tax=Flavobacterium croceum DSM 17960 TaxID=1121886 RepID=A0A2S4N4E2_9FLAO|nr:NACHT domain-containing protein [Flavobacterium croceum]POS00612.1 NACHT domain-containing protein [Flavobacterium croceum DSM 17960]